MAVGPSTGKAAEAYLQGRSDKGCFVRSREPRAVDPEAGRRVARRAGFVAELKDPFGVLLR